MIRVNLLAPERATKKKTGGGPALPSGGALQSYLLLALFAGGAVRAALFLHGKPPGVYSMKDVLGL